MRLNERKVKGSENVKKMAYLIDLKTICVGMCLFMVVGRGGGGKGCAACNLN